MRIHFRFAALAAAVSLTLVAPASMAGTVFYDSGFTGQSSSSGSVSPDLGNRIVADEFTVAAGATWSDLHFWTLEGATLPNQVTVQYYLFNNVTGDNSDSIFSGQVTATRSLVQSGVTTAAGTLNRYFYSFDLASPYALSAGSYYLGLHMGTTFDPAGRFWESLATAAPDSYYRANCVGVGCNWTGVTPAAQGIDMAYQLTQAVPEPGSLALFALGLAGLGLRRRRR